MALIKCHECGTEVSTEAASCPKCGAKIKKQGLSVIHWIGILVVVWIIYIFLSSSYEQYTAKALNKAASSGETPRVIENTAPIEIGKEKEIYQTTSKRLFSDYEKNEVAIDENIKGKQVILLGVIQSIEKDFTDNIVINLKTNNEFMPSRMQMNESEKPIAIERKKGEKVAITCESISRLMGSPSGTNCIFTKPVQPLPDYS